MRTHILAGISVITSAAAAFYMEPLIPLGDWRWLFIATMGAVAFVVVVVTDPKRRGEARSALVRRSNGETNPGWMSVGVIVMYLLGVLLMPLMILGFAAILWATQWLFRSMFGG